MNVELQAGQRRGDGCGKRSRASLEQSERPAAFEIPNRPRSPTGIRLPLRSRTWSASYPDHAIDRVQVRVEDPSGIEPDQTWQLVTEVLRIRPPGGEHHLDTEKE